jgi:hypothetical protein
LNNSSRVLCNTYEREMLPYMPMDCLLVCCHGLLCSLITFLSAKFLASYSSREWPRIRAFLPLVRPLGFLACELILGDKSHIYGVTLQFGIKLAYHISTRLRRSLQFTKGSVLSCKPKYDGMIWSQPFAMAPGVSTKGRKAPPLESSQLTYQSPEPLHHWLVLGIKEVSMATAKEHCSTAVIGE